MDMDKLLKVFDGVSIGNLLTKDNAIKAFVLVMVLAFMLEMVSLGYLGGLSNGAASGPVANSSVPAVVYGTVIANGTIASFDPVLYITGPDLGKAPPIVEKLISEGIATYSVPGGNDTLLVNVVSESSVQAAAAEFSGLNVSVFAPAQIQFSGNLDMVDNNGKTVSLIPTPISYQLAPSMKKGGNIQVSFSARGDLVQGSPTNEYTLTGWGSISILPTSATVLASMPVLFKKSDLLSVSIPWIARSAVSKQEVVSALSGFNGTQVTYSKRSYIEFGTPLTQAQYNALSAAKPAYVTSLQPNYAGVQDGFANTSSVLADMTAYSPGFPTSDLTVEFSGNSSGVSGALSAYLASKNITAQPTMSGAYVLSVPDSLVSQDTNETYTVAGGINNITIESNLPLALGSNVTMALSVSEVAGVIVDISGATPISARTPGNATQTMPPLNSTGAAPGTGVPPADNSSANATTVGNTGANSSAGNSGAFVPVDNSSSSAPANNSSSSAPVVNSSAPVFTGNA